MTTTTALLQVPPGVTLPDDGAPRLEWAFAYARAGWPVVPLHWVSRDGRCSCGKAACGDAAKHPRTAHGLLDATTDPHQLRFWWQRTPQANLGLRTGPLPEGAGVFAVDEDPRHGGDETWRGLVAEYGPPPETVEAQTGGGGTHRLYRWPDFEVKNFSPFPGDEHGPLGPGLDIRGLGGYLVAAPSIHRSGGAYHWARRRRPDAVPIAPAPDWLLAKLRAYYARGKAGGHTGRSGKAPLDTAAVLEGVPEGQRDATLWRLACKLRGAGVPEALAVGLVRNAAANCTPPFPEDTAREKVARAFARYDAPADPVAPPDDGAPPRAAQHATPRAAGHSVSSVEVLSAGAHRSPQPGKRGSVSSVSSVESAAGPVVWGALEPSAGTPLPTFPVEALPDWLQTYVTRLADATQTPVDLTALLALGVLSVAAGGRVKVWVRATWQEPVNLYLAPALESGNRKSAVERRVTAALRAWEQQRAQDGQPDVAAARSRRRVAEQALEHAETRAAKESAPDQRAVLQTEAEHLARKLEQLPVLHVPRLLTEDCTPERLAGLLAEQGGRMAIVSAEGDVFDIMAGRYSSEPNFVIFLKGHAGDPHHVDRQGRPAEYIAEPALTIAVSPQPDVLAGLAGRPGFRGRGLLARFLCALPRSLLGERTTKPPEVPDEVQATYDRAITALLTRFTVAPLVDGKAAHHSLKPDAGASAVIDAFLDWVEPQLGPTGELAAIKDWGGKLTGALVRIAGLLHLAEHPHDEQAWKAPVGRATLERAVRIATYLIPHAQAVHDLMGLDPEHSDARVLVDWLRAARVARFTKREAQRRNSAHFRTAAQLAPVFQLLEEQHIIRHEVWTRPPGHQGRAPSPTYLVNPALFTRHGGTPPTELTELTEPAVPERDNARGRAGQNATETDRTPDGRDDAAWPATPVPGATWSAETPFVPSTAWQEVPDGQPLPPGGEGRLGLGAGGKTDARWPEGSAPSEAATVNGHASAVLTEDTEDEGHATVRPAGPAAAGAGVSTAPPVAVAAPPIAGDDDDGELF